MNAKPELYYVTRYAIPALLLVALWVNAAHAQQPAGCGGPAVSKPLVYTRQPRAITPVGKMSDAANWQHANDISRVWYQSETDVVLDDNGVITVIHDCTGVPETCTAQEAKVSPDGKRILYSVSKGPVYNSRILTQQGTDTGLKDIETLTAELWLYDVATKQKTRLSSGFIDRSPDWASNDVIVFASNRAGTFAPMSTLGRNFYRRPAFHIHRARIVGNGLADVTDITPAEHFAMNPKVLTSGEISYSSFQGVAPREFGSTPENHWWISSVDINGNAPRSLLGAHGSGEIFSQILLWDWLTAVPDKRGEGHSVIKGLRPTAEVSPGRLCTTNYYRGNSGAMGELLCWQHSAAEGASQEKNIANMLQYTSNNTWPGSGRFVPSTIESATPYGQAQDMGWPRFHKDGRAAGRAGFAAAWPDSWGFGPDAFLFTHARGWCFEAALDELATTAAMGGEPTCKKEIRLALGKQVRNPFEPTQSIAIACADLNYQCWDAQPVASYREVYGIDAPRVAPITTPTTCELRVVNARAAELDEAPPKYNPTPEKRAQLRVAFQGNADPNYSTLVQWFGVEYFDPWKSLPSRDGLAKTYPATRARLEPDGSVRLPVDCGRPFQHFGYDASGKVIASGLVPLAARGVLTCHGCHDGHSQERLFEIGNLAPEERFKGTDAGKR